MENILTDKVSVVRPRLMKVSKILLIVTAVVLYVMQGFVAVPMYGIMTQQNFGDFNFYVIFILLGVSLILAIVSFGFAIAGAVKKEGPQTKLTLITKIALIPFFAINIRLWLWLISGMMNPFLLLGIPFAGAAGICLTYMYMLMTSLPDIVYTIIFCVRNKRRPTKYMVIGVLLSFFFVADIVGCYFLHRTYNEITEEI